MRAFVASRRELRELALALWDLIAPPCCPGCGRAAARLCAACAAALELRSGGPRCGRCGEPLAAVGAPCTADHRRFSGLARATAPFAYRGTGGRLVRRYKFERDAAARALLAEAMVRALGRRRRLLGRAIVVAVPMHGKKRRRRGFDPAASLADEVARRLGARFLAGALRRVVDTLPQGDPRVTSRDRNVEGAFRAARPRALAGRRVLLVDDVVTSGATARACARVLRQAGVRDVELLTAARAR